MSGGQFAGYWREGDRLVMDRNAVLPDRCVKCDQPADGYRRTLKLSYSSTSARFLFGEIALLFAKRANVAIGLCERHRPDRGRAITPGLVAVTSLLGLFVIVPNAAIWLPSGVGVVVMVGLVVAFVVASFMALAKLVGGGSLRASKITDTHLWLKGAGAPFIDSLAPPPLTAEGALPALPGTPAPDPAAASAAAFGTARNGAIAFAAGAVITAATYLTSTNGRYSIIWGLVVFGLIAFLRGANAYRRVPATDRTTTQVATLGGILAIGLLSAGVVVASEVQAGQDRSALDQWNAAVTQSEVPHAKATAVFNQVANSKGPWTAQNAADMKQVATYYTQTADTLDAAPVPSEWAWYKAGLVSNYRTGADIATQFSLLTSSSSQSTFTALVTRWTARTTDFQQLQQRLDAQNATVRH